jgi:hypothetical protein
MPKKRPDYRKDREHTSFVAPLHQMFPSQNTLHDKFIDSLSKSFEIVHVHEVDFEKTIEDLCEEKELSELCRTKHEDISSI